MASSSTSCALASASTSTADGNNCYQFDVFLNHRGPDVKNTFVSHLYNRLRDHRLRVFLDREEIRKGEELTNEIDGAIRAASVHLAIFSPNYCESPWCLNELLLMLEMKQKKGSTILPIFFHVKPSALRWTEGEKGENRVYAEALRSLQKKRTFDSLQRYDSNTIGKWKNALKEVAGLSGFELDEAPYNRDEGMLLAAVVERLLKIVPKPPLDVSKYPTGLDDKIKAFEERVLLQQHQNGKARIVGIVGLGGVGKTTLAKEFFNRERTKYPRSSFLCDVREKASRGSLESLQIQLIKDLSQVDVKINNTHEGISILKQHLSHCHALIIVDDADHIDQLEALLPAKDVLNCSSLILVTSRDKSIFTNWGVEDGFIYMLEGLNPQHSTELFCWHAFRQPHAVAGFEQLVNDFLDACKGLPLSLKVIGSLLYRKNLEHWKAQLRKISKILPEDIQRTLKISYDSLDEEEKQIFLDIACIFIGRRKETAIRVWDGSGWEGSLALQNLQDKCLVEVKVEECWDDIFYSDVEAERIRMHDHLRDLGRDLASKEPLRRIRFAAGSLGNQLSVGQIKTFPECDHLVPELRLQLPNFEHSRVEGIFSVGRSLQLIYLYDQCWQHSSSTSTISTPNLLALHIETHNLETLWSHESEAPLNLRQLQVGFCRLSKIPKSIGQLKHLEKIVLSGGAMNSQMPLQSLPEEFCHLASLKHLVLSYCHLRSLPDAFGNITSLQYVNLSWCNLLEMLPDSFGYLTNLQDLLLMGCDKLQNLPDSFGNLTKLQHIALSGCGELQMLPSSFGNLINLQHIALSYCGKLQMLPSSFGNLTKLQHIRLSGCGKLQMLPSSFGNLTKLQHIDLSGCEILQMLPSSFGNLINLQHIDLSGCEILQMLPSSFGNLIKLQHIALSGCGKLQMLPSSFGKLTNLQHIDLSGCQKLQTLPNSFRKLTKLQHIRLSRCSELRMPPNYFENFIQLKYLHLTGCKQLTISIETLEKITTLEDLSLSGGFSPSARENIEAVPAQLAYLRFLQRLRLDFDFKELPSAIGNLSNLKTLELKSSCLESLPPSLGDLRSLKELTLAYCSLKCLRDSIRMLSQLEMLNIEGIKDLEVLEIKESLSIEEATFKKVGGGIETTTDSRKLEAVFPNLQQLRIEGCDRLVKVGALPATLKQLHTYGCRELEELPSRETLPPLMAQGWGECPKLKEDSGRGFRQRKQRRGWRIGQNFKGWAFLRRIRQSLKSWANSP